MLVPYAFTLTGLGDYEQHTGYRALSSFLPPCVLAVSEPTGSRLGALAAPDALRPAEAKPALSCGRRGFEEELGEDRFGQVGK